MGCWMEVGPWQFVQVRIEPKGPNHMTLVSWQPSESGNCGHFCNACWCHEILQAVVLATCTYNTEKWRYVIWMLNILKLYVVFSPSQLVCRISSVNSSVRPLTLRQSLGGFPSDRGTLRLIAMLFWVSKYEYRPNRGLCQISNICQIRHWSLFCFANPRVCPEINLQAFETKYLYSW